jgi:hypothetical protein
MRAPTTKTLVVLAFIFLLASAILVPQWYPPPYPVLGPDGSAMHGPDGKILVHRDMTEFNRALILPGSLFIIGAVCVVWLFVRLLCFFYARWRYRNRVA